MTARTDYDPPTMWVDVAYGRSFRSPPTAGTVWTPLTEVDGSSRLRSFSFAHSRPDVLSSADPSTATVTLDNADGFLDDMNPSGGAVGAPVGTPIRIRAESKDVFFGDPMTTIIWVGLILDGWLPSGAGLDRTVTVTAVDAIGWAAQVPMPTHPWTTALMTDKPRVWWRGQMSSTTLTPGSAGRVKDFGSAGIPGKCGSASKITATPSLLGERDAAMRVWESAAIIGDTPVAWSSGETWMVACWVRIEDVSAGRYLAMGRVGSPTGGPRWSMGISSSGIPFAEVRDGSGTLLSIVACAKPVNDGQAHLVAAVFTPGVNIRVASDLDEAVGTYPGGAAGGGGYLRTGSVSAGDNRVVIDEWAYWPSEPIFGVGGSLTERLGVLADTGAQLWGADTFSGRLSRVATVSGGPIWPVDVTFTSTTPLGAVGVWPFPSDVAGALTSLASGIGWWLSTSYIGGHRLEIGASQYGADWTLGVEWRLTDLTGQAPLDPDPNRSRTVHYRPGAMALLDPDTIINEIRTSTTADSGPRSTPSTGVLAENLVSIEKYGPRTVTVQTNDVTGDLPAVAASAVAALASPTRRVSGLTVAPWGDDIATFQMLTLYLGQHVLYTECTPGTTLARVEDLRMEVLAYSVQWQAGVDWTVTMTLTEAPPALEV